MFKQRTYCISAGNRTELDLRFRKIMDDFGEGYGPKLKQFVVDRWNAERQEDALNEWIKTEMAMLRKEVTEKLANFMFQNEVKLEAQSSESANFQNTGSSVELKEAATRVDKMINDW